MFAHISAAISRSAYCLQVVWLSGRFNFKPCPTSIPTTCHHPVHDLGLMTPIPAAVHVA